MKKLVFSIILALLSTTTSFAQGQAISGTNEGLTAKQLQQSVSPWGGEPMSPADTLLIQFLEVSAAEIGQVANCSAKEAQIMWTCTIQIAADWARISKDPNFTLEGNKEQYLKNMFIGYTQTQFDRYKLAKERNDFTCSMAAEVRRKSSMFNICTVKEE